MEPEKGPPVRVKTFSWPIYCTLIALAAAAPLLTVFTVTSGGGLYFALEFTTGASLLFLLIAFQYRRAHDQEKQEQEVVDKYFPRRR